MVDELGETGAARVLEPSAGDGALVVAVRAAHPDAAVTAVERDPTRVALLRRRYGAAWHGTFQDFADHASMDLAFEPFDAVVMNPPFTEPGDRHAWATHFQLAWRCCARAVGSSRSCRRPTGSPNSSPPGRCALVQANAGVVTDLPAATFRGAGTGVRTILIAVTRGPDTDPDPDPPTG